MVGGLWFFFIGQALPETAFDPIFDLTVALMAFLGGFGTLAGPGARRADPGAATAVGRDHSSPTGTSAEIVLGVLFLLVILFLPRGHPADRARSC